MKIKRQFSDKTAVVTGGASGIGKALCQALIQAGVAQVVVADIQLEQARKAALELSPDGSRAIACHVDVSQPDQVQSLVDDCISNFERIDYFFNNAGTTICGEVRDMSLADWQKILDINLFGTIHGTHSAYQAMIQQGSGHIINVASLDGLTPMPFAAPYTAAKHGVVGLSMALRMEAARYGIKVSVVCPGAVRTSILDTAHFVNLNQNELRLEFAKHLRMMEPDVCANNILKGVIRNQSIILDGAPSTPVFWWVYRLFPDLYGKLMISGSDFIPKHRLETG